MTRVQHTKSDLRAAHKYRSRAVHLNIARVRPIACRTRFKRMWHNKIEEYTRVQRMWVST